MQKGKTSCNLSATTRDWEGQSVSPLPSEAGPVPFLKPDCGMEAMLEADYPDSQADQESRLAVYCLSAPVEPEIALCSR